MSVKSYSYSDKTQLTTHYNVQEFKCKGTTKHDIKIDSELPKWLEKIMPLIGAKYGNIYSGYRCVEHDKNVGGSGSGSHVMGYAVDIWFKDAQGKRINATKVAIALEDIGYPYGIGWRCGGSSPDSGNIHIDTRPRKIYMDESKSMSKSISTLTAPSDGKTGHNDYLSYIYKPTSYYTNAKSGLNIRNEANTNSKIVGCYAWGTKINVYYIENGWAKVGVAKWVNASYLQTTIPIDDMSKKEENTEEKIKETQDTSQDTINTQETTNETKDNEIVEEQETNENDTLNDVLDEARDTDTNNALLYFIEKIIDLFRKLFKWKNK